MLRGRYLHWGVLAGTLALIGGLKQPSFAAAPTGYNEVGMSGGSGSTTITGEGAEQRWDVKAIGEDLGGTADRGYFVYTELPANGGVTARVLSLTGGSKGG